MSNRRRQQRRPPPGEPNPPQVLVAFSLAYTVGLLMLYAAVYITSIIVISLYADIAHNGHPEWWPAFERGSDAVIYWTAANLPEVVGVALILSSVGIAHWEYKRRKKFSV